MTDDVTEMMTSNRPTLFKRIGRNGYIKILIIPIIYIINSNKTVRFPEKNTFNQFDENK